MARWAEPAGGLRAGGRPSGWHALREMRRAGQAGLRWVAGWAGPSLSHKAAKPCGLLAAGQPDYAAGWAVLGRAAGWARPVSYTRGPEAGWRVAGWAGPEASRRHVRHASRRAD